MLFQAPTLNNTELDVISSMNETKRRLRRRLYEPVRWHGLLRRLLASENIQASTGIEGHRVSRDDAIAAVDQADPFEATGTDWRAVLGYREAMAFIVQLAGDPHFSYNDSLVRSIHYMMMKHDPKCGPGLYRRGDIYVGQYQGPDPEAVPTLVSELMNRLNHDSDTSELLIRAAMAHLNLIMIHPFRDGNGRMSRALQTLVLGRDGTLDPRFSSIEEYLGHNTPAYYQVLTEVGGTHWNPERDARPWIRFVLTAHHYRARLTVWRFEEADRIWDGIAILRSQARLDERNMGSMYNAAMGFRVRRSDHMAYADVSERVATSDLRRLVDLGFLETVGERRGRYYVATDRLSSLSERERPSIPAPFGPVVVTPVP